MNQKVRTRKPRGAVLMAAWKDMAVTLASANPTWTRLDIARAIQKSDLARKDGRAHPYSLTYIMGSFRGLRFGKLD